MYSDSTAHVQYLPGNPAYNKARKQYLKSNRNRPSDSSSKWTPFRASEKKYMTKFPPPDLSEALDLALLDEERKDDVCRGGWKGNANAIETREIVLKGDPGKRRRRAFYVPQVPGLVILPGYLNHDVQRRLVRWSLAEHARTPNQTNLDAYYEIPAEGIWNLYSGSEQTILLRREADPASIKDPEAPSQSVPYSPTSNARRSSRPTTPYAQTTSQDSATASQLLPKLRWANIGWFYNWGTKQYEFSRGRPDIGEPVRSICKEIVRSVDWRSVFDGNLHASGSPDEADETSLDHDGWDSTYEPDAGIVNFYQYKDTLMGHVDRAEVCATSPLVSISLGNAAVFLIGGLTKDENPVAILLRSGDAVVMAGPGCRRAYHGVPRILEGSIPAHFDEGVDSNPDWAVYSQYLRATRININVRQVFPKAFDPSQAKLLSLENDGGIPEPS